MLCPGLERKKSFVYFSVCLEQVSKLGAEEFRELASSCLLSHTGLATIPRVARPRILKKALKFVEIRRAEKAYGAWDVTERWLQEVRQHFDKLKSPLTTGLLASMSESDQLFVDRLEQSGGEEDRVLRLLISMINADCRPELVRHMIVIWRQDSQAVGSSLLAVFEACVKSLFAGQSIEELDELDVEDACSCLKLLLRNYADDLLPSSRIRSELAGLCTLESLPVADRLEFIQLLKGIEAVVKNEAEASEQQDADENLDDFDGSFLAELYQLQQAVELFLPGSVVKDADLAGPAAKAELLARLLEEASTCHQLEQLAGFFVDSLKAEMSDSGFLLCVFTKVKRQKEDELFTVEETITNRAVRFREHLEASDGSASAGNLETFLEECWREENLHLFIRIVLELKLSQHYDRALEVLDTLRVFS